MVAGGSIGDLLAMQSFFSYRNVDPNNIRNIAEFGGGALMDIGCYPVNVARMMFGAEPTGVRAVDSPRRHSAPMCSRSAILDFGGRHAAFTCSTQLEDEPAGPAGGDRRTAAGRDPVQHPARPPHQDPPRRRWRPTGVAGGRRSTRWRRRPVRHPGRRLLAVDPREQPRCRPIRGCGRQPRGDRADHRRRLLG